MLPISNLLKRNVSLKEIEAILEKISKPAILFNKKDDTFSICNTAAIEVSGYSRKEIADLKIDKLLPELLDTALGLPTLRETPTNLQLNSGVLVPVQAEIIPLSEDKNWVLLTFETVKALTIRETRQSLEEQRWEALHSLALAPLSENPSTSIQKALQAGQLLTGCSFLALYQPNKNDIRKLNMTFYRGDVEIFPKEISRNEISHLRIPFIWEPGKRSTSIFHQRAISANLTYIATCPLDKDAPLGGILVIGDQISSPPKEIFDLMQIISGVIVTSLKHHNSLILAQEKVNDTISQLSVFNNIKEIMSDGIIYTDENHLIIDINRPALIALGYSESEVLSKPLEQIIISGQALGELMKQISHNQAVVHEVGEIKIHRRDGEKFLANVRMIRLSKENTTAKNVILLSDLSAKEEFRTRTKQLENQAILGEVMAIFAHEVRNPINNISMGLEVLSSLFESEHQVHDEIDRLKIDIHRLEDLMKSVLSVSRTREYRMEQVHALGLVESLVYRWKPRMEQYKIFPVINTSEGEFTVKGDKRSLEQVFTNIIQNGINAMKDKGGTLTIRFMAENEDYINIDISDTGPGIPKAIMDRIFDPFFSTNKEGTGLGLAITRQIINAHNGQVSVNSVPGGTVFRIKLPKYRDKSQEKQRQK